MIAVSTIVYGAPAQGLVVMFLFVLLYVQIPGLALLSCARIDFEHRSTTLIMGLLTGWGAEILIYFITDVVSSNLLLYVVGPIISLIYIINAVRQNKQNPLCLRDARNTIGSIPVSFCIFLVLILLYCIINTQYKYMAPAISESTYMNPDKAYHLGLINSLSHDYPLESPWVAGVYINYHIFSEILFSIPVRLFNISVDVTTQSFGPFMTAYCFGLSLYSFFREMSSKPERSGVYCLIVLLSNMYITRSLTSSVAFQFILINDNSAGYGMSAVLMAIVAIKKWYKAFLHKERGQWTLLGLCTLLIMLATGIKGPMGAVTLAGLWGTVVLGVILRRINYKIIVPIVLPTIGFASVYFTVLGAKGQSNASGNSVINFGTITNIAFWKDPLIAFLKTHGVPGSIRLLFILLIFAIFFFTVFFVPFIVGYIRELILVLSGRKEYDVERVLVYAECMVGFVCMFFLSYSGHSQIYFGLVTAFLSPIVAFWLIEDLELAKDLKLQGIVLKTILACMTICIVFTTCSLTMYYVKHMEAAAGSADPTVKHNKYLSITTEEYEAMEWIDQNTPADSLLAIDRYYSVRPEKYSFENRWDNRFFLYEVYSNRFSYISGSGYNIPAADWDVRKTMIETNNQLYDDSYDERGDLARELGVDYIVVSKRFTDAVDLANEDYDLCFTNEDIDIYEVKDAA